jgi:hypothetical protein
MRGVAAYKGDLKANLEGAAAAFLDSAGKDPGFFRFYLSSGFAPVESEAAQSLGPWMEAQFKVFEKLFEEASADHGNMKGRQTAYAASFTGTVHAYVSLGLMGKMRLDDKKLGRIIHYFMHGIFS